MRRQILLLIIVAVCVFCGLTACSSGPDSQNVAETQYTRSEAEDAANSTTENTAVSGENTEGADTTKQMVTEVGTYPDGSTPQLSGQKLRLIINGTEEAIIALYDNSAVDALLERLPLTELSFFDLSGIEKPIEQLEEPLSLADEEPGYDPVAGEMVIYRPWGNFTIFYGDFRYSDELVPLGIVESGLDIIASQTEDFTGELELITE